MHTRWRSVRLQFSFLLHSYCFLIALGGRLRSVYGSRCPVTRCHVSHGVLLVAIPYHGARRVRASSSRRSSIPRTTSWAARNGPLTSPKEGRLAAEHRARKAHCVRRPRLATGALSLSNTATKRYPRHRGFRVHLAHFAPARSFALLARREYPRRQRCRHPGAGLGRRQRRCRPYRHRPRRTPYSPSRNARLLFSGRLNRHGTRRRSVSLPGRARRQIRHPLHRRYTDRLHRIHAAHRAQGPGIDSCSPPRSRSTSPARPSTYARSRSIAPVIGRMRIATLPSRWKTLAATKSLKSHSD